MTDTDPMVITVTEAAELIRRSSPERVLHLPWGSSTLRLVDVPGNEWAVEALTEIREAAA